MRKIKLKKPTLILGCGISATGKSTILDKLVRKIYDTMLINKDTVNESFLGTHNKSDTGVFVYRYSGPQMPRQEYFGKHVRFQSYHCMLNLAKDNLLAGKHPILEGNYTKEITKGYFDNILFPFFEDIGHKTKIIFCYANESIIRERLRKRGVSRDDDKLTDEAWENLLKQQPILPKELEKYNHLKVDTSQDNFFQENIKKIVKYLKS